MDNSVTFNDDEIDDDDDDELVIDSVPTRELPDADDDDEDDIVERDNGVGLEGAIGGEHMWHQRQQQYNQSAATQQTRNGSAVADAASTTTVPAPYQCHPNDDTQQKRHNQEEQQSRATDVGILERNGRWLMSIPRDDVLALQQTPEYFAFLESFEQLGKAHRRTVVLNRRSFMECEEEDYYLDVSSSSTTSQQHQEKADHSNPLLIATANVTSNTIPLPPTATTPLSKNHPATVFRDQSIGKLVRQRKKYSFLQHLAVDDVILRVFEFLDCTSLARTSATCHRFRELSVRSATQRTSSMCGTRLLCSAMKLLRAREQIEGVGPRRNGPFVPVPMLGLSRRVEVTNSGDAEYNGIYFCTGSNGNGFLFTKPRVPERRIGERDTIGGGTGSGSGGGVGTYHHRMGVGGVEGGVLGGNRVGMPPQIVGIEGNMIAAGVGAGGGSDVGDDVAMEGEEAPRGRLLRCVIAKRFSNENILWYMSKEVEDSTTHEITQVFSFWAKLMVIGDATPDICRYPSQTSILSRNSDPAWQPLASTRSINPPTVELLDG